MTAPDAGLIHGIEELLSQRLDLLKMYPVLSVQAMQCLEQNDADGLNAKLDERGALVEKADALNRQMTALVSGMDEGNGRLMTRMLQAGADNSGCPEWGVNIARSVERTKKLLQGCALFDEKLLSYAKLAQADAQSQLGRIHAQRKINSAYNEQNAVPHGTHIHFSSK